MKRLLPLLPLLSLLLPACIIDGTDSGYYDRDPYYDDGYYDRYERDRRGSRRDRWDDDDYYDRRPRDHHRHDDRPSSVRPGDFTAGGGAKEFPFSTGHRRCTIEVVDGSVGFNTIVVRRGGAKQSITISATYQRGQSFSVPIDAQATGLRISDTGRGRYRVIVR